MYTPQQKGSVSNWNGNSEDGSFLKQLIENNNIDNMKPSEIKMKYPQFGKYTASCLSSAVTNARRSHNSTLMARKKNGTSLLIFICIFLNSFLL